MVKLIISIIVLLFCFGCNSQNKVSNSALPLPKQIVDLGTLVTEDIVERLIGNRWRESYGFTRPNQFETISWTSGPISGQNSYYTLFNHGGPHVDAPNHFGLAGGLDSYAIEVFAGPLRVFDVSRFPSGRTVSEDVFLDQELQAGDIVLIYTGYKPPVSDAEFPESITLTRRAAEFLVSVPIRAFGTDAYSAGSRDKSPVEADTDLARLAPIHEAFLSAGIPIYEQLFNLHQLVNNEKMYFVGIPVNIENGDGMLVRPVALLY